MTERVKEYTAVDIARESGKQLYEVLRAITKADIKCIDVIGGRRVFGESQKEYIISLLKDSGDVNN